MNADPYLSVLIPTRDRPEMLMRTIGVLLEQAAEVDEWFEIVVVNDGSKADLAPQLALLHSKCAQNTSIHIIDQPPLGPAAARNAGIRGSKGKLILFLGDDIVPLPGLLRAHVNAHKNSFPEDHVAILGVANLPEVYCRTPFAKWWIKMDFRYDRLIREHSPLDFTYFYTNNISLSRDFLLAHGLFDESFHYAAYEDTELGFRLAAAGLQIKFLPSALAEHWHVMNLHSASQRMITRGKAIDLFNSKTPLLGIPKLWKILGNGPWMSPALIKLLYKLTDWLQTRFIISPLYIVVLMYFLQVGRGSKPPLFDLD